MKALRLLLIVFLIAIGFIGGYGYGRWYGNGSKTIAGQNGGRRILHYVDPMHPAYTSDKPGIAPDCGMKLVPVYEGGDAEPEAQKPAGKIVYYKDPKAPNFKSDKPGINPETGSDLEPVYENDPAAMPMGTIKISAEKQQLIGVKFGDVTVGGGVHSFRSVGKVTMDETRFSKVQTRIDGWIEKVFVDFTGKLVEKGQPLLTMYSPEMLASQREYLLALRSREIMKGNPILDSQQQSDSLLAASRKRLELFSLSEAQIQEITRTQQPLTTITIYSTVLTATMTAATATPVFIPTGAAVVGSAFVSQLAQPAGTFFPGPLQASAWLAITTGANCTVQYNPDNTSIIQDPTTGNTLAVTPVFRNLLAASSSNQLWIDGTGAQAIFASGAAGTSRWSVIE